MDDIIQRLNAACVGQPAHIPWPHRLLHDAKEEFERLRAEREELWVEAWVAARLPDSGLSPLAYQRARGEVEAEARRRWKERGKP